MRNPSGPCDDSSCDTSAVWGFLIFADGTSFQFFVFLNRESKPCPIDRWILGRKTWERPPEGVVCFAGKLCRNAAHAKRSQVFFSQVAKKKNIHTEELSSVCNHQRTKIPPVTMCIIHRKNTNFGCNLLQHTSVPKNILSVCNQQRTKISPPPPPPPKPPPCHNVNHPPKNINFGCNLLQHTSVPKKIQSVCNPQRTKISPPHPPHPMPRQSTKHHYFSPTSSVVATNNERE